MCLFLRNAMTVKPTATNRAQTMNSIDLCWGVAFLSGSPIPLPCSVHKYLRSFFISFLKKEPDYFRSPASFWVTLIECAWVKVRWPNHGSSRFAHKSQSAE